ncbi:MAG: hypothetical protein NTY86_16250 [Deltaproteobacteria bacterium]|nr:hypothetical protein [Deltaproteobacteria bacterium]
MKKTEPKESQEIFRQVETALYHIHTMANVLEDMSMSKDENTSDGPSNPLLSLAQIIREKAEFCLTRIDEQGLVA